VVRSEILLTKNEIDSMIAIAVKERLGRRDSLLIRTLRCTGIRRCEASRLSPNQINFDDSTIHVVGSKAKRHEDRIIPIDKNVTADLRWYINDNRIKPREHLFGVGDRQVDRIIAKYALSAAIGHHVICHDLRAYFITYSLHMGIPLFTVQRWAGHKDPMTTKLYYRLPSAAETGSYDEMVRKL
jgi:integrase